MAKNRVTVMIDGREYPVASIESVEHIEAVAQLVDTKVRELRNKAVLNHELALVFAALNLADELVRLREMPSVQKETVETEVPHESMPKAKRSYKRTKKAE